MSVFDLIFGVMLGLVMWGVGSRLGQIEQDIRDLRKDCSKEEGGE